MFYVYVSRAASFTAARRRTSAPRGVPGKRARGVLGRGLNPPRGVPRSEPANGALGGVQPPWGPATVGVPNRKRNRKSGGGGVSGPGFQGFRRAPSPQHNYVIFNPNASPLSMGSGVRNHQWIAPDLARDPRGGIQPPTPRSTSTWPPRRRVPSSRQRPCGTSRWTGGPAMSTASHTWPS